MVLAALTLSGCASGAVYWGGTSLEEQTIAMRDMPEPPLKRPAPEKTASQEPQTPGSRRKPSTAAAPSGEKKQIAAAAAGARKAKAASSGELKKMSDVLRGSDATAEDLAMLKEAEAEIEEGISMSSGAPQKLLRATMSDITKRLKDIRDAPTPDADMTEPAAAGIVANKHFTPPEDTAAAAKPAAALAEGSSRLPKVAADTLASASDAQASNDHKKHQYASTGAGEQAPAAAHQLALNRAMAQVSNPLRPQAAGYTAPPKPSFGPQAVMPAAYQERAPAAAPENTPAATPADKTADKDGNKKEAAEPAEKPGAWKVHLRNAIISMEKEAAARSKKTRTAVNGDLVAEEQVKLRMLYLLLGKREAAFRPFTTMDRVRQDYWQQQLYAIDAHFNPNGSPLPDQRAALALRHLRESAGYLAALSRLEVRNLQFCTQVDSYGRFVRFPKDVFKPNQEVLLYAEVDNFQSNLAVDGSGFETELQGSYQIFDIGGQRVADHVYPVDKERCGTRHRDFFIPFRVYMPKFINPGDYILKLTVEDKHATKFGQAEIKFKIDR